MQKIWTWNCDKKRSVNFGKIVNDYWWKAVNRLQAFIILSQLIENKFVKMFVKILETWNTWTFLTCPRKGGAGRGRIAFLGSAWQRARLSTCTNLRTKFFLLDNQTSSQSQRNLWSRNSVPELSMSKTWKSGNTDKKSESARLKISINRWLIIQTFIPQIRFSAINHCLSSGP